ncbi:MAG: hypothetical protein ACRC68_08375 [Clostridium sp.]
MKKNLILIIVFLTMVTCYGFSYVEKSVESFNYNVAGVENNIHQINSDEYIFEGNNISIKMNDAAVNTLQKLGKENQYFESQSCAFPGLDKVYTYNSFEITTYPINNVDYIESIFLLDDTVKTPEGVCLYQTLEDMKKAYGENYEEVQGIYTYQKGKSKLSFMIKDNKITQIEYKAIVK